MESILFISIGILLILLSVTIFNFITAPMLAKAPKLCDTPKVSVLIPARNEEKNIAKCIEGLLKQDYENLEIIVLNDHSEDKTVEIVKNISENDKRVRLINGKSLPAGWTGKNWACHQLSENASGDIIIFTDADNQHAPFAVKNTVAFIQKFKLGLLSAFPQQWTISLIEKMIVPVMDIFVYGSLPLWATYYAPNPSLAAANGQWLAFTKATYLMLGGHQSVKNHLVEDTELNRLAKKNKIKTLTTAGTDAVFCRMYQTKQEVWEGFTKNFFGLTGYHNIVFWGIICSLFIAFILPYFSWIIPSVRALSIIAILLNLLFRFLISIKYKHPLRISVLLHPVSIFYSILIGMNSFFSFKKGIIRWKGRDIQIG